MLHISPPLSTACNTLPNDRDSNGLGSIPLQPLRVWLSDLLHFILLQIVTASNDRFRLNR